MSESSAVIKAVVFDAYGTLFDIYSIGKLAEQLFPGAGSEITTLWRQKQVEYSQLVTLSDPAPGGSRHYQSFRSLTEAALRYALDKLKLSWSDQDIARLLGGYDQLQAYPECMDVLCHIQTLGLPTAILSNGSPDMLTSALKHSGLAPRLNRILSADQIRIFKTHPSCYDLVPAALGLKPAEILFVSSNSWDILGAGWYGFMTCWINRNNMPFETIGPAPYRTCQDLTDVLEILEDKG